MDEEQSTFEFTAGGIEEITLKVEEVHLTENKVRTAILQGVDPVGAYLKYRKF